MYRNFKSVWKKVKLKEKEKEEQFQVLFKFSDEMKDKLNAQAFLVDKQNYALTALENSVTQLTAQNDSLMTMNEKMVKQMAHAFVQGLL